MVSLTIDNKPVTVPEGTTIMEAAESLNIPIPKLCFLKEVNDIGACRVCVVEVEGRDRLLASCNTPVDEGMVVYTNSPKVRKNRRKTVEMILCQHNDNCVTCVRNQNCSLQSLAHEMNILEIPYEKEYKSEPWNKNFPLIRDSEKCIKCMRCIQVCNKIQNMNIWDTEGTAFRTDVYVKGGLKIEESDCTLCGQCVTHCPVGALTVRDDTLNVWKAIEDPETVTVVQVAPAVRTAWGESFNLDPKDSSMEHLVSALKQIGFDYVFDSVFSADLTIMEEGTEFIKRFSEGELKNMPMFTSCCPGWLRFIKGQYPHLAKQLSTAKSPQQMFGAVMKSYFAEKIGVKPEKIVTVSVMPCMAKKGEEEMPLYIDEYAGRDIDFVLTTREITRMIRTATIDVHALEPTKPDQPMQAGSGAGVIFGTTGGVMEAALRSAHYLITGKNPDADYFKDVRSERTQRDWKEADAVIGDLTIHTAVVNGLANTRKLIDALERGEVKYDFVEVMACPGGCVGGGGQPIHDGEEYAERRAAILRDLDYKDYPTRFSHENQDVAKLYEEFLGEPNSHKAHMLLHTDHKAWDMPKHRKN